MNLPKEDLTRRRFGLLTVLSFVEWKRYPNGLAHQKWLCQCDCGKTSIAWANALKRGLTKSCGCRERMKHGYCSREGNEKIYDVWSAMKNRCQWPKNKYFHNYGGRGIKVCERWQDFRGFIEDMGPSYLPGLTIERINNDGNYEPGNCKWATRFDQMRNTRRTNRCAVH